MSDLPSPDYRSLIIAAIILAAIGWLGLYFLLTSTLPTVGPRWLFFFLWTLAVTGTALPFVWMLHLRFGTSQPAPPSTLLRHGLWVGLYTTLCIWLQINRSLSLSLAVLLAVGFAAIEWFLRVLERSTWSPGR
jgi:hypothetical protein